MAARATLAEALARALRPPIVAALAAGATGCLPPGAAPSPVRFEVGEAIIASPTDTFVLRVEIARTEPQQSTGLSGRPAVAPDAGMIFLFDEEQPADNGFWMFRTLVPLSAAFLDRDGMILRIVDMEPCSSRLSFACRRYPAEVPFHAALEVNRGWFRGRGIGVGDRVTLRRDPP